VYNALSLSLSLTS